ncbi:MAG TPA: biotin/lipoyl-containing protein [Caulobacteraceae bacterium]|nr:biotin/lipoyl-containing protein [Caulobacteraceae bacterium]
MADIAIRSECAAVVLKFSVAVGDRVSTDQELLILESMKTEIPVTPPRPGRVKSIGVAGAAHTNHARAQHRFAWPSADWGSMPIEGGIEAAYRAEIEAAPDTERRRQPGPVAFGVRP